MAGSMPGREASRTHSDQVTCNYEVMIQDRPAGEPEVLFKQLTVPWAQSLVPRTWRDRLLIRQEFLAKFLERGCQVKNTSPCR
jgi:hypothetical protein